MKLTFSSPIEAADSGRRIISGIVVPFNKVGHTSVGAVIFERGSIEIPQASAVKLLAQHSQTDPIGRAQSFNETADAIHGTFKVSASQKGTDYLIMASEDLISGLSVGVDVIASKPAKDGTLYVQKAVLREVSLVESPAFEQAKVYQVSASESEAESNDPTTTTESEAIVSEETPAPEAVTPEAPAAETVEASRPTIKASVPYNTQTVRSPITSMGGFALHSIKAQRGDEESALYVKAAADSTTTNPAFNPNQYLSQFVSNTNFGRAAVDACTKGVLPSAGFTINVPSLITPSQTAPTVAAAAEAATISNTGMTSAYQSYTVNKYAGQQTISLELIDRSDPIFMDQLMIQLERAYLKATDAAVIQAFVDNGTTAAATANTAAGLISFLSTESAAAYAGTSYFAKNVVIGSGTWAAAMNYQDSTGRPIFNTTIPGSSGYNAAGQIGNASIRGNLLGLDTFVDVYAASTAGADNSAFVIAPEAVTVYESPTAMFSVNIVNSGQVNLAIYGYMAAAVLQAKGVRKYKTA